MNGLTIFLLIVATFVTVTYCQWEAKRLTPTGEWRSESGECP